MDDMCINDWLRSTNGFQVDGPIGKPKVLLWECDGVGDPMSRDFRWGPKRYYERRRARGFETLKAVCLGEQP